MAGEPVVAVAEVQNSGAVDQTQLFGAVRLGDVAQFQAGLVGASPEAAEPVDGGAQPQQASIYNKMLGPLYEFRKGFDEITNNISGLVNRGNMRMADLFSVQFQLMQLGYMNDLSAKTADKLSQGVQTLFRNQG
ncbi:MAG: EscI/YscI/HrpB family type III secretion system inner rod protein [Puniceicoccales bacterium]|jgi:hypothetical protein|nr:EscI/YscI/HrpB family type III secretion system inner rod protein [Puniceicoccales bacterium]